MKLVNCSRCEGTGRVKIVPYYANPMPPKQEMGCEACDGRGKFEVVSGLYKLLTESEAELEQLLT